MRSTAVSVSQVDDEARIKLIEKQTVWKNFVHLQTMVFEQQARDGRTFRIHREVHDHGVAAAILLFDPKREDVVLVRQFRPGAYANGDPSFMLEIPAGLTDGDQPDEAIRRESMEETGYAVSAPRYLFDTYASPGTLTEKVSLFYARVDLDVKVGEGGGLENEGEDIEVLTMPLEAAYDMIASGEITDSKTIIMLQWAMLNRASL